MHGLLDLTQGRGVCIEHSWPQSSELLLAGSLAVRPVQRGRPPPYARVTASSLGLSAQGPALPPLTAGQEGKVCRGPQAD